MGLSSLGAPIDSWCVLYRKIWNGGVRKISRNVDHFRGQARGDEATLIGIRCWRTCNSGVSRFGVNHFSHHLFKVATLRRFESHPKRLGSFGEQFVFSDDLF